jgi:ATP-binding cassette subfamily B (MDR/TAP) protein 1
MILVVSWCDQVAGFTYGISQFFLFSSYALGLWYGAQLVKNGEAKFKEVITVFMVLIIAAFAIAETLSLAPDLIKGGQALTSVFHVLDRVTRIDADEGEVVQRIRGEIELKHVAFAYPTRPDAVIFTDLSLRVRAGRSLALVGASGSGKSSVVALLERFYDPVSGRVLVDGKDIRKLNLKRLRRGIALVSQEPALFATTIYENILYGRDDATEQEVHAAAMAANAHHFISALPDGYNTQVGERGVQLSGGQKQRVAIARAVLKNPAVLLLDEATSALDAESEKIVQEALDRLMQVNNHQSPSLIQLFCISPPPHGDTYVLVVQNGEEL